MKILWRILALFKFFFLPPLAALGVWIITSFTSTMVRLIPWLIQYLLKWTGSDDASTIYQGILYTLGYVGDFLNRLLYGLDGWLPVSIAINCFVFVMHFKFTMWFQRMFVKAVTFGKV